MYVQEFSKYCLLFSSFLLQGRKCGFIVSFDIHYSLSPLFPLPLLPLLGTVKEPQYNERPRYRNVFLFQAGTVHA
jgi:hypothetical protein